MVNNTDRSIGARTTQNTNPADSNGRILVFYDHDYKRFQNMQYKRLAELIFRRHGLSKYELEFVPSNLNPTNMEDAGKERGNQRITYRSVDEIIDTATKKNPQCLIFDPSCVDIHPDNYETLLKSLAEQRNVRGIVTWAYKDSYRPGRETSVLEDCRKLELPTVTKGLGTTSRLAKAIKKELKRYEATQTT